MKLRRARALSMTIHSSIKANILEAQSEASKDVNTPAEMLRGLDKQFKRKEDGELYFVERIWVPAYGNLRTLIMNEAHATKYFVHPRADKMYYDLRDLYWWPRMKKDIALHLRAKYRKQAKFDRELSRTTDRIVQIQGKIKSRTISQKSYARQSTKAVRIQFSVISTTQSVVWKGVTVRYKKLKGVGFYCKKFRWNSLDEDQNEAQCSRALHPRTRNKDFETKFPFNREN
ncbi:putative reverse transcriptase domain-containing protein [Tanacetum coccineum]